jgi:hypothetical protein
MTQIASSPVGHKLKASGHGPVATFQKIDSELCALSALPGFTPMNPPAAGNQPGGEPEDGDGLLTALWRTSSYLETVQWELDAAQESLLQAVQQAANSGVGQDELCRAANMTREELAALLDAPAAGPAVL